MIDSNQENLLIKNFLSNPKLKEFIITNLKESLPSIGFSQKFVEALTTHLIDLNFEEFCEKFSNELENIHRIGFFQKIVPKYFKKFVIPEIPSGGKILDVGCGTGILIKKLSESKSFTELIGIDINEYPEWKSFKNPEIYFKVVNKQYFSQFLEETEPDSITLTWTLHHMGYNEQEHYLKTIFEKINPTSKIIILEDSYSEKLRPQNGENRWRLFMKWNKNERKMIMSIYDWIANRILAQRKHIPLPFGYRTMEDWKTLFENIGFAFCSSKFIGFPDQRDINTPQSLFVFQK